MRYHDAKQKLDQYREQIAALRAKMRVLEQSAQPEAVEDYVFASTEEPVRLSQLFGRREDLFVIHNMGARCLHCTMWADGFNGILSHLESRAAFVVSSPDEPAAQQRFKESRGWRFRLVSHRGTSFAADMGYRNDEGFLPGVSVFRTSGDKILRVADTRFSPLDDFCTLWHFWDLLPEGAGSWQPKYRYDE